MKELLEAFRATLPLKNGKPQKNYSVAKILTANGGDITTQGVDGWEKGTRSVNIDSLVAIKRVGKFTWNEIGRILEGVADKPKK